MKSFLKVIQRHKNEALLIKKAKKNNAVHGKQEYLKHRIFCDLNMAIPYILMV